MNIKTLTFNLEYSKGLPQLLSVVEKSKPDIIAVQEFDLSKESIATVEKAGYIYADHAESFKKGKRIYGVATFYRRDSFDSCKAHEIRLPRSIYEIFWFILRGGPRRTVIRTILSKNEHTLGVYNVHFSPYAVNSLRNKQLEKTLKKASEKQEPTIILGDFNYPYKRSTLETLFEKYGFKEATTSIFHTFFRSMLRLLPIQFKLDYVFFKDITHITSQRMDAYSTDHTPILSEFEL